MLLRSARGQTGAASGCAPRWGHARGQLTRSPSISSRACGASNACWSTSAPPLAREVPNAMPKLPDQNSPLAVQERTWSSGPTSYMRRKRHSWMATPRWALRMPLGRLAVPEEKNSTAGSLGRDVAARGSHVQAVALTRVDPGTLFVEGEALGSTHALEFGLRIYAMSSVPWRKGPGRPGRAGPAT